jgi:hypothetical protein
MNIDDDCTVVTDMPLSDEVADFIEAGLHRGMTKEDVEEWCDNNLDELASIYEKYRSTYLSYGQADMTLFLHRRSMREMMCVRYD